MSEGNWLEQLKPGDKVAILGRGGQTGVFVVTRITPATIEIDGRTFYKKNGRERGTAGSWDWSKIVEMTPEIITRDKKRRCLKRLNEINWAGYPLETLEAICALVEQAHKDKEAEQKGKWE